MKLQAQDLALQLRHQLTRSSGNSLTYFFANSPSIARRMSSSTPDS